MWLIYWRSEWEQGGEDGLEVYYYLVLGVLGDELLWILE
jgi:hypothetical protein